MNLSVVICTHNRADLLAACLDSIARCTGPRHAAVEVVVVDNGSTDHTRDVIPQRSAFPFDLKCIREDRLGLSRARNRGWQAATGDVAAFLDDDVLVDERYLATTADVFLANPDLAGAGGKVLPSWEAPRPSWLSDGLLGILAVCDYGDERFLFSGPHQLPRGANILLQRSFLEETGGFRVDLGRVGGALQSCEDDAMVLDALAAGRRFAYEPSIVVHHRIGAERLTRSYFRRWKNQSGRSLARMKYPPRGRRGRVHPWRTVCRAATTHAARLVRALARGDMDTAFQHELELRGAAAVCRECWFGACR